MRGLFGTCSVRFLSFFSVWDGISEVMAFEI